MSPVAADRAHSFAVAQAHAHGVRFHVKADVHPGDLADIGAFVSGFIAQDPAADLAPPSGVFDLQDIQAFVGAFTAGCP